MDLDISKITYAETRITQYLYDEIGRLTNVIKPDQAQLNYIYSDYANAVVSCDENDNKITRSYDARNQIIGITTAQNGSVSYQYNGLGNMTEFKDYKNQKTTREYDNIGRLSSITYANGTSKTFAYDAAGNMTSHTDPNGKATSFSGYDSLNRPKTIHYADNTDVTYTYDQPYKGKVSQITITGPDPQEFVYEYDPFGNLKSETKTIGQETFTISYEFDDTGLLKKETANKTQINYYDTLGRITKITYPIDGQQKTFADHFTYQKTGELLGYSLPLIKSKTTYKLDKSGRITNLTAKEDSGTLIMDHSYLYDLAGNRKSSTQKYGPGLNSKSNILHNSYAYNALNQLVERKFHINSEPEASHVYAYDLNGNRTEFEHTFASMTSEYNNMNQITAYWDTAVKGDAGWWEYSYDNNGNRTQQIAKNNHGIIFTREYVWNARNQLTEFKMEGTPVQQNKYEFPSGLRYEQKMFKTDGNTFGADQTIRYYYDQSQRLLSEKSTQSQDSVHKTADYIYLGSTRIAKIENRNGKDVVYFNHNDPLGTAAVISFIPTDITQPSTVNDLEPGILAKNVYMWEPFGNLENAEEYTDYKQPFDFTGKFMDWETHKLHYFYARYLDPLTGQFLGKDPASPDYENPFSFNPYIYCLNNPLKYIDPDGRKIFLAVHKVFYSKFHHSSLFIVPDNQNRYILNKDFANMTGGGWYATIGAGPIDGNLFSDINRPTDINKSIKENYYELNLNGLDEDSVIDSLSRKDSSYGNNLDYTLFPSGPDEYNSNSYIRGLIESEGIAAPDIRESLPGFDNPVPAEQFFEKIGPWQEDGTF